MRVVCLDLEGVLVPEIWINVAEKSGIEELRLTTRDISDYDVLMRGRLKILEEHNLTLSDIQAVIGSMEPLEGALEFLNALRGQTQVFILSDTFTQFASPLMEKLGWPTLLCNYLIVDSHTNMIVDYKLRQKDGKRKAVEALQSLNYKVFAGGDSYNDLSMIKKADAGALFRAPEGILKEEPHLPFTTTYDEFRGVIEGFLKQ